MTISTLSSQVTITVRGPFSVTTADKRDVTPRQRKDRALLALLAMSPGHRRSRAWLQSMLWSNSPPAKAAASLRRSLANLRALTADNPALIGSDKIEVWLPTNVVIDTCPEKAATEPLLELIDAPDPAFDDWLRDLRSQDESQHQDRPAPQFDPHPAPPSRRQKSGTVFVIRAINKNNGGDAQFLEMMLIDILSSRLEAEGADHVYAAEEPDPERLHAAASVIYLELTSIASGEVWNVHLRALADQDRQFIWSGRMQHRIDIANLAQGSDMQAFASRALAQVLMRVGATSVAPRSPLMAMHRAASRLYISDLAALNKAEGELLSLSGGEGAAIALAWRAFARLAQSMEFADDNTALAAEAESLANEALSLRPANPLVCAMGARVALDLKGDLDLAEHLSRAALYSDDGNPYALQAQSRFALLHGDVDAAHRAALSARRAADGLPHVFAWDMEVCLTALGKGDMQTALEAAQSAHRNNPSHRAALRYLVALRLLVNDRPGAEVAAQKLRQYEPDFTFEQLRAEDYPMLTLRNTGFADQLVI